MVENYVNGERLKNQVLSPLLSDSKNINISTGYFSVKIFEYFKDEFLKFYEQGNKIKLIIGSDTDVKNIEFFEKIGKIPNDEILEMIEENFFKEYKDLTDESLITTYKMLQANKIEIKIGYSTKKGIFHAKDYMFEKENQLIVIKGSLNFTTNALINNYESVIVLNDKKIYLENLKQFNSIWNNIDLEFAKTQTIEEHLKGILVDELKRRNIQAVSEVIQGDKVQLRDYQNEAIIKLDENDFNGLLEMATGTGKTFTALYGVKQLFEKEDMGHLTTVVVPYQHLATQWVEEIQCVFGKETLVLECHSDEKWEENLSMYISQSYDENVFLVMVDKTFFKKLKHLNYSMEYTNDILIVDEAHNLSKNRLEELKSIEFIDRKIALTATPNHYLDDERTNLLFEYFKGAHFKYGLEEAIKNNHLTPYEYIPTIIELDSEEESKYKNLTRQIKKETNIIKKQNLMDERSEILSNAKQKLIALVQIIKKIDDMKQSLIYCNSGKVGFDSQHDYTHIEQTAKIIREEYKSLSMYQITYRESNKERKEIVNNFVNKDIDAILAIRCLDEGYNIPAIKRAFILSSTRNPKEYVQRRGRVLRLFEGKDISYIYDFIVSVDKQVPYEEKIRFEEYSTLAVNKAVIEKVRNKVRWSEND